MILVILVYLMFLLNLLRLMNLVILMNLLIVIPIVILVILVREGWLNKNLSKSWYCQEGGGGRTPAKICLVDLTYCTEVNLKW